MSFKPYTEKIKKKKIGIWVGSGSIISEADPRIRRNTEFKFRFCCPGLINRGTYHIIFKTSENEYDGREKKRRGKKEKKRRKRGEIWEKRLKPTKGRIMKKFDT